LAEAFRLLVLTSFCCRAADWPQFLGPDRNGVSQKPMSRWLKDGPDFMENKSGRRLSGPVVHESRRALPMA
jgi:hypothetical protein